MKPKQETLPTLDLHGVPHREVEREVENFALLSNLPFRIITGKSDTMQELVMPVLDTHQYGYVRESGAFFIHCIN
jgi:hypothetical protein